MPDIERRRAAAAAAWDVGDAVVLVAAGDEIPVPGRGDRTYPYRAHSEYLYLTDRERPGGVLAFDPGEGWIEFVVPVTADELLWTGFEGDREGVPEGTRPRDELEGWLGGRPVRRLGATDDPDDALRNELIRVRRPKDDDELERMRIAAEATRAGFAELAAMVAPGRTERELQVALEAGVPALGRRLPRVRVDRGRRRPQRRPALRPDAARAGGGPAPARRRGRRVPRLRERRDAHLRRRRRARCSAADRLGDRPPRRRGGDRRVPARRGVARGAPDRRARDGRGPGRARRPARHARDARRERRRHALLPPRRRAHGRPRRARRRLRVRRGTRAGAGPPAAAARHPAASRATPGPSSPGSTSSRRSSRATATAATSTGTASTPCSASAASGSSRTCSITEDGCDVLTAAIPV